MTLPPLHPRCRCAIAYREVGTPRVNQPREITIVDCKTFEELKTYWADKGTSIQESVRRLDFAAIKEASAGFERAMELIPSTRQYLKEIRSKRGGDNWLLSYTYADRAVNFNQSMFLPENIEQTRVAIKHTQISGLIARNSTIESMAAHEIGHAANLALTQACGLSNTNINKVSELFVKDVFYSLPKAERATGLDTLRRRISKLKKYAQTKSETLSEAINDFVANGEQATVFSKALVSQIEAAISGNEFLTKHILSQDSLKLRKTFGWACLDDVTVRKWYLYHDTRIHDLIDSSLPMEQKARKAFDLRNEYRTQARDLMNDLLHR